MDNKKVYVDMDGTIADFNGYMLSKNKNALTEKDMIYKIMVDYADECFRDFKQLPYTEFYMSMLKNNHNWHILSALPKKSNLAKFTDNPDEVYNKLYDNKVHWCVSHGIPKNKVHIVEFAINKQDYCKPGDTLIDDNILNIKQWESKGGKGEFVKR